MINSLILKLKSVKDYRQNKGKRHELWVILTIVILGNMLGFHSYRALGDFTCFYQKQLYNLLKVSYSKMPSYSTIRRVMNSLDTSNLISVFNQWAESLILDSEQNNFYSIDGKTLRNTLTNTFNYQQNFLVFISLFCQETGLVLKIQDYENKKSSEIKKTQKLIETTNIRNSVLSLDALHCQKETTKKIIEKGNDYLITVKKNQRSLYKYLENISKTEKSFDQAITFDKSHGRKIERKVSVWENQENQADTIVNKFSKVKSLIKVERKGIRGKKKYEQIVYYISSKKEKAESVLEKIQGHWKIENQLHWVKDVVMEEDRSLIKNKNAASNISVLKTIGINLFRLLNFTSITKGRRWLSARLSNLFYCLE